MYLVAVNPSMQEELVGLPAYHASAISDPIEMMSAANWPSLRMKTPKSPRHNHDARVNGCYSPLTLARLLTLTLVELRKLQKIKLPHSRSVVLVLVRHRNRNANRHVALGYCLKVAHPHGPGLAKDAAWTL